MSSLPGSLIPRAPGAAPQSRDLQHKAIPGGPQRSDERGLRATHAHPAHPILLVPRSGFPDGPADLFPCTSLAVGFFRGVNPNLGSVPQEAPGNGRTRVINNYSVEEQEQLEHS